MIGKINLYPNSPSIEDIEGLQEALDKRTDTSELLKRGKYNGNASDLKADIDRKVSKEEGKGLSSNDYTNAEKQKNEENALKKVVGLTVTGDVNKIITITFADSTVMQAPFNDNDHISLPDVNMNSMNFNENTGVLTGVKSDGQEITVSLDGRYSLIGHHHDDRYAQKTHTHPNYSLITHQHNWDDILRKPNNLATNESVKEAIEKIQIGGRNLLKKSGVSITNNKYEIASYQVTEYIKLGDTITLTIDGDFADDCWPLLIAGGGNGNYGSLYRGVNVWKNNLNLDFEKGNSFSVFIVGNSNSTKTNTIRKIKLERGNKSTDWSPAPEDIIEQFNTLEQRIAALEAKF